MSTSSRRQAAREDAALVEALRAGDERAFVEVVRTHHSMVLRVAMNHVSSRAVAEEVVQETWLAVLNGLDRFEARSSLKTWIFRIAANIARTRGVRESRCLPFSSVGGGDGDWPGAPASLRTPEERLLSRETRHVILAAIDQLPPAQRLVVTLRDIGGWSADEACQALAI